MTFNNWLDTFVEEKGLDMNHTFEVEGEGGLNLIPLGAVVGMMQAWPTDLQAKAKTTLVKIDFANGDSVDFLKYIAAKMAV
tara:strand:- start:52 stop:294 length:243 start_codon:yes stop_codon:yes gene_type:complete